MLRKLSILIILGFTFFPLFTVHAATDASSQIPELNPFCWHRIDCHKIRKQFGGTGTGDEGFITDASVAPCTGGGTKGSPEEWGRCLPAGTSKTAISFGGKDEFSNIGEFIILMYKYLLTIASIVAVVVIIIAGMQWVSSGGNSEAIGSAKKRISGALIGLFIAYMSYFVLNTINPALVNLRLPQVWLVRPQALMPEFCSDIPGATTTIKFAKVGEANQPNAPLPPANQRVYQLWNQQACGSRFLAENGGDQVCTGNGCDVGDGNPKNKVCFDMQGDGTGYECGDVRIAGKIIHTTLAPAWFRDFFGAFYDSTGWKAQPVNNVEVQMYCGALADDSAQNQGYWGAFKAGVGAIGEQLSQLAKNLNKLQKSVRGLLTFGLLGGRGEYLGGSYAIQITVEEIDIENRKCFADSGRIVLKVEMAGIKGDGVIYTEDHYIGRNGVDLGNAYFFFNNFAAIDYKHFYSYKEFKKGIRMNINADNIVNVQAGGWVSNFIPDSDKQNKANEFYKRYLKY